MNFFDLANPLTPFTRVLIAVFAAVLFGFVCYTKGHQAGMEKYYEFRTNVETASAKADAEIRARDEAARSNTAEVARLYSRYASDVDRSHRTRLDGVLRQLSDCQTSAATAGSAGGINAASPHPGLAQAGAGAAGVVQKLESDCADTTLQLVWLQKWVGDVCR